MSFENVLERTAVHEAVAQPGELMEPPAFRAFYDTTSAPLRSYLTRLTGSRTAAEDLAQEAFIRLMQASPRYESPAQLKSYLYRTATNLFTDRWRKRRREAPLEARPVEPAGEATVVDFDLERALDRLKPRDRAMIWLAYVEGLDHREIAAVFGVHERSVRVILFRARKKLAAILEKGRS